MFAAVRDLLQDFGGRAGYGFSDTEVLDNLRAVHAILGMTQAAYLGLIAELDTRPDALPEVKAGKTAVTFLRDSLRVAGPQANRDVRAAAAIASASPELPAMGAALADGEVSREHVDVAVSTLGQVPQALKTKVMPVDEATGEIRTGATVIDELLTGQSRVQSPATVEVLGRQIVARLDPDRVERFDADAYQRRGLTHTRDFAGMTIIKAILDPADVLPVLAALTAASAPLPPGIAIGEDGKTVQVTDERTPGQRKVDALVTLLLAGARTLGILPAGEDSRPDTGPAPSPDNDGDGQTEDDTAPDPDTEPEPVVDDPRTEQEASFSGASSWKPSPPDTPLGTPASGLPVGVFAARPWTGATLSLVATVDQLAYAFGADDEAARTSGLAHWSLTGTAGTLTGATVAPEVLARFACDNPIRRILIGPGNTILNHGRAQRFASPAQKRALAVRDQGCVVPGCHCPPDWCDAHHILTWEDGGNTDLGNLALLCARHHAALHAGVYELEFRDGIPWIRLPAWQDLARPWMRNITHHDHHHAADQITRQLTENRR